VSLGALGTNAEENRRNAYSIEEPKDTFGKGATRSAGISHLRYDLIPADSLRRLAARWGLGAKSHGEYNWLEGEMPGSVMIYHLTEHLGRFLERREVLRKRGKAKDLQQEHWNWDVQDYKKGDDDLAAVMWGLSALMYLETNRPDLLVK
jgi:hypothetical protein